MNDKRIGVGVGVMLLKDGKVLLGKRNIDPAKATSLLDGAGTWTMPGGKVDFGETLQEGAARELFEETGIVLEKSKILCLNEDRVETAHFITIGVLAEAFSGEAQVMEPDKITDWTWFDLNNLPEPLYFPSEKVLANYNQGAFYIPS
jgi:8-oxo-dGTP diphosphatase